MGLTDLIKNKFGGGDKTPASPAEIPPVDSPQAAADATAPSVSGASDAQAAPDGDKAAAASPADAASPKAPPSASAPEPPPQPASPPPSSSPLRGFTEKLSTAPGGGGGTDALNSKIVQAVQLTNSETAAYAGNQIAVAPNMMITQASGLVAQAGANYFDGASKLALASKSVLLKNMTEKFAAEDIKGGVEDALGILITDLLVGTAAAVAAAAGAMEGEAAHIALDKIDQSLNKYQAILGKKVN
ncbi:hypothetical protein ACFFU8_16240 [Chromobacterium piscinae]|uniref:hypothetical protein n=1 Tax=Chromobacterium piscinae TaxID=686831 RepID=UPI001E4A3560|nr:hypothetical protein [Chromobacterium piscinae]MCD5328798.1 hypothetical protein [Chromobacterium piscinae]